VLVLNAGGQLEERQPGLGLANWEYSEVVSGLVAGERLVTSLERPGVRAGAAATVMLPRPPADAPGSPACR